MFSTVFDPNVIFRDSYIEKNVVPPNEFFAIAGHEGIIGINIIKPNKISYYILTKRFRFLKI